jgi:predicted ATPase/transcriptional regulator with XRE-family HTH domain
VTTTRDSQSFARTLRHYREAAGLSQEALAERAGLSARGVSDLERGLSRAPRLHTLSRLCEALALSATERAILLRAGGRLSDPPSAAERTLGIPSDAGPGEAVRSDNSGAGSARASAPDGPAVAAVHAEPVDSRPPVTGLPGYLTGLLGRERDAAAITRILRRGEVRLLTLVGPGGVGKTRLAVHVAAAAVHLFADGVAYAPLAPLRDPALVLATIAQAVGVGETGDATLSESLVLALHGRRMLLVLDNCEHVVEAAPAVAHVLGRCPGVRLLATSRTRLRVQGEQVFPVRPLPVPGDLAVAEEARTWSAVALFIERAQAVRPDFALTEDNLEAVVGICRRLDGLPLALELAAARVAVLPPAALLQRLDQRLPILTHGARDAPARHRTLQATIAWSYDLLSPAEQRLLRWLSVFRGGWSLDLAEAVYDSETVLDDLASLVEHSLVQSADEATPLTIGPAPDAAVGGAARDASSVLPASVVGKPLEPPRSTSAATEPSADLSGAEALRRAVDGPVPSMQPPARRASVPLVRAQMSMAATARAEPRFVMLVTIGGYAFDQLLVSGDAGRAQQRHASAFLRLAEEAEPHLVSPNRLPWLRRLDVELDNLRAALTWSASAEGDPEIGLRLTGSLAWYFYLRGHLREGRSWAEQLLARAADAPLTPGRARGLYANGGISLQQGDVATSRRVLTQCVELFRAHGDYERLGHALTMLGLASTSAGQPELALDLYDQTIVLARQSGDAWLEAHTLTNKGAAKALIGDSLAAHELYRASLAQFVSLNDDWGRGIALRALAGLAADQEDYAAAQPLYEQSVPFFRQTGDTRGLAQALLGLGKVALRGGGADYAQQIFAEGVGRWREVGISAGIVRCLVGLAGVAAARDEPQRAVRLFAASARHARTIGVAFAPIDEAERERTMADLRSEIDDTAFATAWAAGEQMTLDQAIQDAPGEAVGTYPPLVTRFIGLKGGF